MKQENNQDNISDLLDDVTENMPDVQQHAIDNEIRKSEEITRRYSDLRDGEGIKFNPVIHETNDSGAPKLTKGGKLRKMRGKGAAKAKSEVANMQQDIEKQNNARQRAQVAGAATALTQQLGVLIGGEDARYLKDDEYGLDEKKDIFCAYDAYMEANGIKDIPPNLALVLAVGAYGFRVMTTKSARNRSKTFYHGIKYKIGNLFNKSNKNDTLIDSRNDGKRKDKPSKAHGGSIQVKGDNADNT